MPRIDGINPLLVYDDLQAAHDFLVEAFGFTSGGVERADDQRVVHAEVRAGDTTIWLHRAHAGAWPGVPPVGGVRVLGPGGAGR